MRQSGGEAMQTAESFCEKLVSDSQKRPAGGLTQVQDLASSTAVRNAGLCGVSFVALFPPLQKGLTASVTDENEWPPSTIPLFTLRLRPAMTARVMSHFR